MIRTTLCTTLVAMCSALCAADIYVATTGSDTTGTGAIGTPYATPRHAAQQAVAGDTIILRAGTYAGNVELNKDNLTLRSYTGEWAVIHMPNSGTTNVTLWVYNTGTRIERLEISGGSPYSVHVVPPCNGCEFADCKIHGADWIGIKVSQPDNVTLRRCEIYDTGSVTAGGMGIDCVNGDNILIQDCHFHDCNGTGIYLKGGLRNALVERNLVRNVAGDGILLGESTGVAFMDTVGNPELYEAIDGVVRNNIVANVAASGLVTYGSLRCKIYNNTVYNCATGTGGAGLRLIKGAHAGYPDTPIKQTEFVNNIVVPGQASRPFVQVTTGSHDGTVIFNYNRYFNLGTPSGVFWDELVAATAAYNLSLAQWQTRTGFDTNSTTGDPGASATTYHLGGGSACIDAATTFASFVDDYDGNTRTGTWDIGADESGGTALPTPPAAGTVGTGGGVGAPGSPTAPTNLTATGTVTLNWQDNSGNETGFRIERRSAPAGTYATLTTVAANTTSHTDDPGPGSWYYRVYAVNAAGDSAASNEANISVPVVDPSPPGKKDSGGGGCSAQPSGPAAWMCLALAASATLIPAGRNRWRHSA
ncbi:MAG: right-handed parallel beta-helix repeat-containing protein [Planctomycetes bacterium]|nr:right-handed parallel beta-helix repeat-containing protein [Planctomycetota bacterium]